ncbi:MAG: pyruvate dehydrogenase complex E1 component subunit beta [Chloroflexi bacterium]|nr:pyruvate dehydrogenase complex E1 component subunit beta [Chloroflexota bacterium]
MPVMTYREALNQALREEMQRDDSVFLMGEDIGSFEGAYKVTQGLLSEFGPRRVKDAPIAEEGFVGAGIGAAMVGLRPVIEIMTVNFILVAIDQVVNNAAKISYMFGGQATVPLVIRTPGGGGHQLGAQHSQSFEHWFANVPGLKVVAPATPADAKGMLKTAIRDDNPVMFMENLALYNTRGEVPEGEYTIPFGLAEVKRPGRDLTIVAHSRMTMVALEAANRLADNGVEAEIVDLRSLRPLDLDTVIESVQRTNRALVIEEAWPTFGASAELAAAISEYAFDYLDAPVKRVGSVDVPMPYAKVLERATIPSVDDVMRAANQLLGRKA